MPQFAHHHLLQLLHCYKMPEAHYLAHQTFTDTETLDRA
jgi:hypothetical protein